MAECKRSPLKLEACRGRRFLYLDFLDATGTLFSMATMLAQRIPGFIDERTKSFPRQVRGKMNL